MDNKTRGMLSETAVIDYMKEYGFRLLVRNYTVHNTGEIDAVMVKGSTLAVIEVKSRKKTYSEDFAPSEAITRSKMRKILKTVDHLVASYGLYDKDIVFLAGLVTHTEDGRITTVEVVPIEI